LQLTIFYDGFCPLCVAEMNKLKGYDAASKLAFVDIQHQDFCVAYPELDWQALNAVIHVQLADGSMVKGLDATYLAWQVVGKGWLYAPLRWPLIRWFADGLYLLFARHRYSISYWLTGQRRCQQCKLGACGTNDKN
jgi:predicted DCC family thiol-disulfide oxidoreductase YuxK